MRPSGSKCKNLDACHLLHRRRRRGEQRGEARRRRRKEAREGGTRFLEFGYIERKLFMVYLRQQLLSVVCVCKLRAYMRLFVRVSV